jgi:hypothetical protein
MAIITVCPDCGFDSTEMRCPRCNALKVVGCSGSCSLCGTKGSCDTVPIGEGERPSDQARDDEKHPGTPLER